jgi:hypothetical protein
MREGNLITRRVVLPLPNDPNIDSDFLRNYAKNWVEDTFGIGDYFCRTSEVDPDFYKLFLKTVDVVLTFKQLHNVTFIDMKYLGR